MPEDASGSNEIRLWDVRPLKRARKEARVGKLFRSEEERVRVIRLLKLLRHWPPLPTDCDDDSAVGFTYETVEHRKQKFIELKLNEPWLSGNQLRIFVWPDKDNKTVWILHGYWKKTQTLPLEVKTRVAQRLRKLKGQFQDKKHEQIAAAAGQIDH